jgi:hypothetical protein
MKPPIIENGVRMIANRSISISVQLKVPAA